MRFHLEKADTFIPDGLPLEQALERTTHLGVGAHQDDLEIMAIDGILACFQREDLWFTGVIVTNGGGSPRHGRYAGYSDEQIALVRLEEQRASATLGEFGALVQLSYSSDRVKDASDPDPIDDLTRIIRIAQPETIYTHDLTDRHDTHVAVALKVIEAIRKLPVEERCQQLYGCEVWRSLDWMPERNQVLFDVSTHEELQANLLRQFESQFAWGKQWDSGTQARRRANATFRGTREADSATKLSLAMDLSPLIAADSPHISSYIHNCIEGFAQEVDERLKSVGSLVGSNHHQSV